MRRCLAATLAGLAAAPLTSALAVPTAGAVAANPVVRIRVLSPDGTPVPGAFVSDGQYGFGRTDGQGLLVYKDEYPAHTVCAVVTDDTQHLTGPTGWAAPCRPVPAPVNRVSGVTLRFTVGAAVTGRLVDARTGRAIPGLRVVTQGFDGTLDGPASAADGTWVIRNLSTDSAVVLNTGDPNAAYPDAPHGYASTGLGDHVGVVAGTTTDLGTVLVTPLVQYRGTVTGPDGSPVAGATTLVGDVDGDPTTPFLPANLPPGITDARGTFSLALPWTATSDRRVCAFSGVGTTTHPTGLALRCVTADSTALTVTRTIALVAGGAVTGRVNGPGSGSGWVVSVPVRVDGEDVPVTGTRLTGNTYRVDGVPAGTRVVVARPGGDGAAVSSGPVRVRAIVTTTVPTVTLP